jgi:predicted RNase H-like HicB family nuclease
VTKIIHWEKDIEMRYNIVIEQDEDGIFIATAPALPGVVEHGDTPDQAFANMGEAMRFTLDSMVEEGEELPNPDAPVFKEIRPIELVI